MSVRNWFDPMREVCTLHSGRIAIQGTRSGIRRQHADDGRGATHGQALDRLAAQRGDPDSLERMIDAEAAGQRAHRLHRVILGAFTECVAPTAFAISNFESNGPPR